jgi:long-chain acyl-CoA synthetase
MVGPTTAVSVPRVYERIHDALHSKMPRPVFERAVSVARQWSRTDDPGLSLRLKHAIVDRFVHASVRDKLGGNVTFLVSGGGSLSTEIVELFDGMGIPILEGYGLTETSPVVSVNPPEDYRPGTLGPPLSNVDVRLDESAVSEERREAAEGPIGELHVSGPSVSEGYWNRPRQTDAAFTEDGWFRTGDIIGLTDDGYLIYHDRLKQLLVLDTGKNVAPQPIENTLVAADPIEQAMVIGDGRRFVAALLVPNFQAVEQWAESERLDLPENREAICEDERVHEHVGQAVEAINETLSAHERIKAFRLVPIEWTAREDLMTPSMKMNRHNIRERFDEEIEAIYADTDP